MDNEKSIEAFKNYGSFLKEVKTRIQMAQVKANFAVDRELIILYWNIGKMVTSVQKTAGWGKGIIPWLAKDIKNEFPEIKGFSERNIGRMKAFHREYVGFEQFITQVNNEESNHSILPQPVAKLDKTLALITELPWQCLTCLSRFRAFQLNLYKIFEQKSKYRRKKMSDEKTEFEVLGIEDQKDIKGGIPYQEPGLEAFAVYPSQCVAGASAATCGGGGSPGGFCYPGHYTGEEEILPLP